MVDRKNATRQRLIQASIRLFLTQGITETTTRQIAELAEVNEVTLFRNFGNKHGLLLAVIENPELFKWLGTALAARSSPTLTPTQALRDYAHAYLEALAQTPEFVRSIIGEAGKFPPDLRRALGQALAQANRYTAQYLATVLPPVTEQSPPPIGEARSEIIASLLNELLLSYAILDVTRGSDEYRDREAFLTQLVALFLPMRQPHSEVEPARPTAQSVSDLAPNLVHSILQQAKRTGAQDYALAYLLFAAGLSVDEVVSLRRSHLITEAEQSVLQVAGRQVPLNQWIAGQRYGSRSRNPLTQWLKTRKDQQTALFLGDQAMLAIELRLRWQSWVEGHVTPAGDLPAIDQAHQTWCVEMLTKGMSVEDLSILSGKSLAQLQPYVHRAREKSALEQALRLDQKPANRAINSPVATD